jgi:hypothetical protein
MVSLLFPSITLWGDKAIKWEKPGCPIPYVKNHLLIKTLDISHYTFYCIKTYSYHREGKEGEGEGEEGGGRGRGGGGEGGLDMEYREKEIKIFQKFQSSGTKSIKETLTRNGAS